MLPVTAACASCGLDGWGQQLVIPIQKPSKDCPSSLMECSVCYEIIHPDCVAKLVSKDSFIQNNIKVDRLALVIQTTLDKL